MHFNDYHIEPTPTVTMAAVMNATAAPMASSVASRASKAVRVAFAPAQLKGKALQAAPLRAARQQISTICKAVVSAVTDVWHRPHLD